MNRNEAFDTPVGGGAWLSELLDTTQSAADASPPWMVPTAGSHWRLRGLVCRRWACRRNRWPPFPTSSAKACSSGPASWATPAAPEHWVGGLAGDDLHAITISFPRSAAARSRSATSCSQGPTASQPFVLGSQCDTAVQLRPRSLRLPRSVVAAGDEGLGRGADPGFRRGARAGRVHPRPSPRRQAGEVLSRNGSYMAYRRPEEHVVVFRDYLRENSCPLGSRPPAESA